MSTDTRQRTYEWDDPAPTALAGLDRDGLDVLRAIGTGELPLPPAVRTLGLEPVEANPGRVSFRLDPDEYHLNPFGIVHGGVLAAVVDTAMGCAVHSLLPPAVGYVTAELSIRFLRPAVLSGGPLVCTGEVDHQGRTTMVASARVEDADGRLIALASSTCLVRRP
ncbi:MAG TPA: PaaI family thioesterase [Nocardioides sp.]|uniref:PaaI family thioesterase n=1 Tax=Nocardioides sp. TaxID=35761 RepID=UPI002E36E97D|nr:PaaI family thioesterase [Nocardioides sp.]HEX5088960.1 PaaI family thioesterase [Nocardioides sp.]